MIRLTLPKNLWSFGISIITKLEGILDTHGLYLLNHCYLHHPLLFIRSSYIFIWVIFRIILSSSHNCTISDILYLIYLLNTWNALIISKDVHQTSIPQESSHSPVLKTNIGPTNKIKNWTGCSNTCRPLTVRQVTRKNNSQIKFYF